MTSIAFLFDETGLAAIPFARAGIHCYLFDWVNKTEDRSEFVHAINQDLRDRSVLEYMLRKIDCRMIASFPDCTQLAVSGAAHFESKRKKDPEFQYKAIELFKTGEVMSDILGVPSFTENPISVAASLYRPPDFYFHPHEYGGYLPVDDVHPEYPDYIAPRDAYPKKTSGWIKNGFIIPPKKPVYVRPGYSDQHKKLGGKSEKTKRIRSSSPRGFFEAVYQSNKDVFK